MARGAAQAQRKQREDTKPKRKRAEPTWEDQLFFSRLRRHAKWVYVALALVFAVGFVAFGVGSGSTGISDILRGNFFGGGGSSLSSQIKDARAKVAQSPNNMEARLNLATLYQQDQNSSKAIATLESAVARQPKNLDVLTRLAGIYRGRAEQAQNVAANAQATLASSFSTPPGLDVNSQLGQALLSDPVNKSLSSNASQTYLKMTEAFSKAESAYRRVATAAAGTPQAANAQLQLASIAIETLRLSGQPTDALLAIDAYQRYLKLEPGGANAAQAKQSIAQLQAYLAKTQR